MAFVIVTLFVLFQGPAFVRGQSIQTINNTLYFRIPGASLALTADNAVVIRRNITYLQNSQQQGSGSSSMASLADVTSSQQTIVSAIQPQVFKSYSYD
jgi:hypothetical protein